MFTIPILWWPTSICQGRMMNKNLGYVHFWVTAVGSYGIFFPMHFVGMAGVPRRYYENTAFPMFDDLTNVQVLMTVFAIITTSVQLVFAFNFIRSIFYGKRGPLNPWKANTLEWTAPQEHIHGNWPGAIPHVHRWAYDYSKTFENGEYILPGQDHVPQHIPLQDNEEELHH